MYSLLAALERRLIRARLARGDPEALLRRGRKWLMPAFRRAARLSPAYRTLLAEAGVDPAGIRTVEDFVSRCPVLDKANTFRRFPVEQLICADIRPDALASVVTSSGHGGNGFAFGIGGWQQLRGAARLIDIGLDMAFDVGRRRSLLVNCLPMGVTFPSNLVCVANVSVREDMACAIVDRLGGLFEQVILCGDPLFLKRLCDHSEDSGLDWRRFRVHVIVGEETFPETFRDYLAGVLGNDPDDPASGLIGSSMGVGELGLNLFSETRETIALRRACMRDPELLKNLTGIDGAVSPAPTFMAFNPLRSFVEIVGRDRHGAGDLLVTPMDERAPIPLMRYATGDRMQFVDRRRVPAGSERILPTLPLVALHGRSKDRLPGGGHVDRFKEALYRDATLARQLSGAHRVAVLPDRLLWEVQARQGNVQDPISLANRLAAQANRQADGRHVEVRVYPHEAFPHGRTLDYERKFAYLGA
jgi:phenylacetate-CoA ligase